MFRVAVTTVAGPGTLTVRLQTIGYDRITINIDGTLKFIAHKPTDDPRSASN
jgi:hypothetical protein